MLNFGECLDHPDQVHRPQPARENDRERFELLGIIDTI
jgi:hypothetical protein